MRYKYYPMIKNKFLSLMVSITVLTGAISFSGAPAQAASRGAAGQGGNLGLGIILGEPTGFTAKLYQGRSNAFDFGLAYSFGSFMLIYSDYLWHFPGAFGKGQPVVAELSPYVGLGGLLFISSVDNRKGKAYFDSSVGFGARIPLGIEWLPGRAPLGVFVEVVPGIGVIPGAFAFVQGGIGIRIYL